jgi:hypothetical protein
MPLSFRQAGNTFIQGQNISIYPSGNSYAISGNAPSTDSFGFTGIEPTALDFGTEFLVIDESQDLTGPDSTMIFKSFSAGTGFGIIDSNNTLIFTAATSTVNGLTSFTSAGTGNILLLSSITNNTLIYKSLTGTSNLSINDNDNGTLTFSLAGGTGTIISGVNIGTNANSLSFFTGLSTTTNPNDTLAFRNILAGDNIFISPSVTNDGDILISRGPSSLVNQLSNIGGGARVLSSITATNLLVARTLLGASGFTNALANAANAATDSDATAFITAASITSTTQITAISNLVFDLKAANLWTKMQAIYPFVGGTEASHKYNLKDPRDVDAAFRLSFTTGWTHSASGATPNGTSAYADSFYNLLSSATQNSHHISYYSRTDSNGTEIEIGACEGSNALPTASRSFIEIRTSNVSYFANNNEGASGFLQFSDTNSRGFYVGNRTASNVFNAWKNGARSAFTITTPASKTPPDRKYFLGAYNNNNTAANFSTKQCSFASIGSGLTDSDQSTFNTIVEAYQTTLGRQVVASTIRGVNTVVNIAPPTTASRPYISNATSQLITDANFTLDSTSGSLGIGGAANINTSILSIAAGSAAISQIRFTAFAAEPTNPSDGSIWYSTSGNTLKLERGTNPSDFIFKNNNISLTGFSNQVLLVDTAGTITPRYVNSFGIFNALSSVTIASTTTETSIISPVLTGSTTLLASTNPYNPELGVGRKYRFSAKGSISTQSQELLNISIKLGSIVISSSSTITVGSGMALYNSDIEIDSTFTIRNSGLVVGSGKISFFTMPYYTGFFIFGIYSQNATIDTASDQVFDCKVQFSVGDSTTILTINESTLEILN